MTQPSIWNPSQDVEVVTASYTSKAQEFVATEGQTNFSLTEFSYVVGVGAIELWVNGAYIRSFQEVSTTEIALPAGKMCVAGDVVVVRGITDESADLNSVIAAVEAARDAAEASAVASLVSETAAAVSAGEAASSALAASASETAAAASALAAQTAETSAEYWSGLIDPDNFVAKTALTGSAVLPAGTTSERDVVPVAGAIRFNSELGIWEGYTGSVWAGIGGGATGGGNDAIFVENGQTVTANYTIPAGNNAHSVGPITVNAGVIVTIPDGSRWLVS